MKIIFFMQDTGAVFGAERATLDLAEALRAAGHDTALYVLEEKRLHGRDSAFRAAAEAARIPVTAFPVAGRLSLSAARAVKRAFRADGGDVLHVVGYKANLHARLSGVRPVVATVHGWLFRRDIKERLYDAIDRWCLKRCDRVICLSTYYRDLLMDAGIRKEALHLIPSGIRNIPADDAVTRAARRDPPRVFGMMGRFSEEKNHAMFFTAIGRIRDSYPGLEFLVAGEGRLESRLRARCAELGIQDRVTFRGYMDVAEFMRSVDAYVICSDIENLPYSILEAMAWSLPVIGTDVGGIPDLVDDQATGRLVARGDSIMLAETIADLAGSAGRAAGMGRRGRERLLREFTLEKSAERHQDLYRSLLTRGADD